MILAFDTYYFGDKAHTVCLAFREWASREFANVYTEVLTHAEEYVSGEFYKRELPCILSLISQIELSAVTSIVIDGFVQLDDDGKLGLGGHLHYSLDAKIPIIGVAKTNFAVIKANKRALYRGKSAKPLFITAIGIDLDEATTCVKIMEGNFRFPKLLKELDVLSKAVKP